MSEWPIVRLGDLIRIRHGFAFGGEHFSDEGPGDMLATPGNFAIGGGFQLGKAKYYQGPVSEEWVLQPGDVIVTMTDLSKNGDTLGYSAVVPALPHRLLHNQRIGRVQLTDRRVTLPFVHWLLRTASYRHEVLASATGSTVRHTSPSRIEAFRFALPPLAAQEAICAVLDALEGKIELNRRMNETLEAMARAIFRDWFVDFAPTRAKMAGAAPYLADDLWALFPDRLDEEGKPEGWLAGTLGQVAAAKADQVSPASLSSDTPYIGLEHMPRRCIALSEWEGAGKVTSGKIEFHAGDLLFGKLRPYFHKVGVAPISGICSSDIVVVRPLTEKTAAFTLMCISDDAYVDFTDRTSTGTKMPRTSWRQMSSYGVTLASDGLMSAFEATAGPMIARIRGNVLESRTLAQTRDLLLPKLMSGEIRVKDAERELEAA